MAVADRDELWEVKCQCIYCRDQPCPQYLDCELSLWEGDAGAVQQLDACHTEGAVEVRRARRNRGTPSPTSALEYSLRTKNAAQRTVRGVPQT